MYSKSNALLVPMKPVSNNASVGNYHPKFFELAEFNLDHVVFNSHFFEETDIEKEIVTNNFSFAYLRENKLRTIDAFTSNNEKIPFSDFLSRLGIELCSKNLFKTGKYLSRLFRPTKYGGFYDNLAIYINRNIKYNQKNTDGISLISLDLAKSLGWESAEHGKSAQFTLFFETGLVKGHCFVSSRIGRDIIIFEQNIKDEIRFNKESVYVAIEPVKLSTSVRFDIQSLLNLWELFGEEQFFLWARDGVEQYKKDLLSGKLSEQLDDFDIIDSEKYDNETWLLKKAIWHKLDYTKFPGLLRLAWQMYRNSILRYAERGGLATFRIPVRGGLRGYLRIELRDHNEDGEFNLDGKDDVTVLDKYGNLWISNNNIDRYTAILGGADMDDQISIVPLEEGKALLYRNPNQKGEYVITDIRYEGIEVNVSNSIKRIIPQKEPETSITKSVKENVSNPLIEKYLLEKDKTAEILDYTRANLLRTYNKISQNSANIGIVANGEMLRSAIGITKPSIAKKLTKLYPWNLERVIDGVVKDGANCGEDLFAVESLLNQIIEDGFEIPKCLGSRIPESKRVKIKIAKSHPVDLLLEAVKYVVNAADVEILGSGSVSRGDRVPGAIDRVDIPIIDIAMSNFGNPFYDLSMSLLKNYNKRMAILLDSTKQLDEFEREVRRKSGIEEIQLTLLKKLSGYTKEERIEIVKSWSYEIYKSEKSVHDSILWITSVDDYRGTAEDTIEMLSSIGLAMTVKKNGTVKREIEIRNTKPSQITIRIWSKNELNETLFPEVSSILVIGKEVLAAENVYNLGDETSLSDGYYSVKGISPSYSRKKSNFKLKNSLTLFLQN